MTTKQPVQDIRERTFQFAVRIVKLSQHLDDKPGVSRTLAKQLLRSGTSIGANAEEARAAQSRADFIHKNEIALKEARETVYWLRLLTASNVITLPQLANLRGEADEIAKILGAIVASTKRTRKLTNGATCPLT